ncbi:MAG: hypothetical protein NTV11_16005 [Rhodocyclales bacterium]|nr:hypothetical protein [Rhodocyclales bacterium]
MTRPKSRDIRPYTKNVAISHDSDFYEHILPAIESSFEDRDSWTAILEPVIDALITYDLAVKANPDRKNTQKQRQDRSELIESLREVHIRLRPLHLPLPLVARARQAYNPTDTRAASFEEEINVVLSKVEYMWQLFTAADIPIPERTNPGKPERDNLVSSLGAIFDHFAAEDPSYKQSSAQDLRNERRDFISAVCKSAKLQISLPRTL